MSTQFSEKQILRYRHSAFAFWVALAIFSCVICLGAKTATASDIPADDQRASEDASESDSLVSLDWPGQFPENERPSPQAFLNGGTSQLHIVSEQWKPCFSSGGKVGRGEWRLPTVSNFDGMSKAVCARRSLQILFCRWAV